MTREPETITSCGLLRDGFKGYLIGRVGAPTTPCNIWIDFPEQWFWEIHVEH